MTALSEGRRDALRPVVVAREALYRAIERCNQTYTPETYRAVNEAQAAYEALCGATEGGR